MILVRNDDELSIFYKMDEERFWDFIYGMKLGCKGVLCFMVENEFLEIYFIEGNLVEEEEVVVLGCGVCECIKVKYDDGFMEE